MADYWAYYTADRHGRPGSPDPVVVPRGLLKRLPDLTKLVSAAMDPSQGGVIDVPDLFTKADLARAHQCDDPVLEEAIGAARAAGTDGAITQFLAGVPDLLNHYGGPGTDPYGRAVITAAMDAARLGHPGPYPATLLQSAVIGYLTGRQRTVDLGGLAGPGP